MLRQFLAICMPFCEHLRSLPKWCWHFPDTFITNSDHILTILDHFLTIPWPSSTISCKFPDHFWLDGSLNHLTIRAPPGRCSWEQAAIGNIQLYSKKCKILKFLSAKSALRNLTASVSGTKMEISAEMDTLAVPMMLSGSPAKFILKMIISQNVCKSSNHVIHYLRVSRFKPISSRTRRSISIGLSSFLSSLQLQELSLPQREHMRRSAITQKRPRWARSKWIGRELSLCKILKKDISCIIPAEGGITLGTLHCFLFCVSGFMCISCIFARKPLHWMFWKI